MPTYINNVLNQILLYISKIILSFKKPVAYVLQSRSAAGQTNKTNPNIYTTKIRIFFNVCLFFQKYLFFNKSLTKNIY